MAILAVFAFFYFGWGLILLGVMGCLFFFWLSVFHPDRAFIVLLGISIFLPIDLATKIADWPRVGPTRIILATFLAGVMTRGLSVRDGLLDLRRWPLKGPIAIFLVLAAVSSVLSINPARSFYSLIGYILEQFLPFFIIIGLLRKPGFFRSVKNWLYILTMVVCAYSILEEIFRINPVMLLYPEETFLFRGEILRVRATFFHPIAFGCFLTFIFFFVLVDLLSGDRGPKKWPLLALLAAITVALMLTVSRGPWMSLSIGITLLWLIWPGKRSPGKSVAMTVAMFTMISAAWIYLTQDAARGQVNSFINPATQRLGQMEEGSSEYYRIALAKAIFGKMQGYRWLFGFGPGTFFLADVDSWYAGDEHTLTAADSHFLKLLFEHGLLGLTAFLVLLGVIIKGGLRAARSSGHRFHPRAAAAACAIVCFVFENLTVSMFLLFPLALLFWLTTAFSLMNQVPVRPRAQRGPLNREDATGGDPISVGPRFACYSMIQPFFYSNNRR